MSCPTYITILAAGKGTRMGVNWPKALTPTFQGTFIDLIINTSFNLNPEKIVIVVGHQKEKVQNSIITNLTSSQKQKKIEFVWQKEQKGTADAVVTALSALPNKGTLLTLMADTPLLKAKTLNNFITQHISNNRDITVGTFTPPNPGQYGRIIRDHTGEITAIIEAKDCQSHQLAIQEVNSGIYGFNLSSIKNIISKINNSNSQGEFYLTDMVSIAKKHRLNIGTFYFYDHLEVLGANTIQEWQEINNLIKYIELEELIKKGVSIEELSLCWIDKESSIESKVKLGSNIKITGKSIIKEGTIIEGNSYIHNTIIGKNCVIKPFSYIENAVIEDNCQIGPFARIREGTKIETKSKIGNFVETKQAILKANVKASHLTYLGNCTIGENTNIGAGTITCNYDGHQKHHTDIGKNCFIGSNSSLIAPVKIGDGATIGAGSAITKDVSNDSLSLTRAEQKEIKNWSLKKKEKFLNK